MIFSTEISHSNVHINKIKSLYESAFPCDERRDFKVFLRLLKEDSRFTIRAGIEQESDKLIYFISYWNFGEFCYCEHFAVIPSMRGQGIGHIALHDFFNNVSDRLILEVEPPIDELTHRRVAFYESLGMKIWKDYSYIQPPYAPELNSLELKLMTKGYFSLTEIDNAVVIIHKIVYGVDY